MQRLLVVAVLVLVTLGSCGGGDDRGSDTSAPPTVPARGAADETARLAAARARWAAAGIDEYRWRFTRRCFCEPWETRVHVEDGAPVGPVVTSGRLDDLDFLTMEELYDVIDAEIDRSDTVTTTYDPDTGQVLTADFDRFTNGADDELGYTVDKFRVLDGG